MTILNRTNDGLYNVLIVLHRTIVEFGTMPKERLIELCKPEEDADPKQVRQTLSRWIQLGLFQLSDDGQVSLDKNDMDPGQLKKICRRILFSKNNNENFWDNEGTKAADFTRALSFILAQDIYKPDFDNHSDVENLEQRLIDDQSRRVLQNDTRWNGLVHWAEFLGFIWQDNRRWPDPTMAISEELSSLFGKDSELNSSEFLSRLSKRLPVLDNGEYRQELESNLDISKWHRPSNNKLLSTSISRALWRLSRPGGSIKLESRSDAETASILQGANNKEWLKFTHVISLREQ